MQLKTVLFGLTVVLLAGLLLMIFSGEHRTAKRHGPKPEAQDRGHNELPLPPRAARSQDPLPPSRKAPETLVEAVRVGLVGQSERWIDALMARGGWSKVAGTSASFSDNDGTTLTWTISDGLVTGATAEFPEGSLSASVSALSNYLVGEHTSMPVHFESEKPLQDPILLNNFMDEAGRRFFIRAKMRKTGPSPFGPESVSISLTPFHGQSHAQSPRTDRWEGVEERATEQEGSSSED